MQRRVRRCPRKEGRGGGRPGDQVQSQDRWRRIREVGFMLDPLFLQTGEGSRGLQVFDLSNWKDEVAVDS